MIGLKLKELRKELRLSQSEFANKLGLKQQTYLNYENGRDIPNAILEKFNSIFDVNLNWLFTGKGNIFLYKFVTSEKRETMIEQEMLPKISDKGEYYTPSKGMATIIVDHNIKEINSKMRESYNPNIPITYIEVLANKESFNKVQKCNERNIIEIIPVPVSIKGEYSEQNIKAIISQGNSMSPLIENEDYVIFVPGEINDNDIYIIDFHGEYRCRRLEFKINGNILILSENKIYEKEQFKQDDETPKIIGKVIGWIHKNS